MFGMELGSLVVNRISHFTLALLFFGLYDFVGSMLHRLIKTYSQFQVVDIARQQDDACTTISLVTLY